MEKYISLNLRLLGIFFVYKHDRALKTNVEKTWITMRFIMRFISIFLHEKIEYDTGLLIYKHGGFVHKEIAKETEEKEISDSKPEKSDSTEKKEGSRTGVSGQISLTRSLSMPAQYRSEVTAHIWGTGHKGALSHKLGSLFTSSICSLSLNNAWFSVLYCFRCENYV